MKILWFPRLQFDVDRLHITTWREMCRELENLGVTTRLAVVGDDYNNVLGRKYIRIPLITKLKYFRIMTFWMFAWLQFIQSYFTFKPDAIILDVYTFMFSFPFAMFPKRRRIFIIDSRTPINNALGQESNIIDKISKLLTKLCFLYSRHFLDGITVITEHYKQKIHSEYGIDTANICVWESGVNLEAFDYKKHGRTCGVVDTPKKLILMQHGDISFNRGLFETIEAVKLLDDLDISLVLVGASVIRNKAKDKLGKLIKDLKLECKVQILPPIKYQEVPRLLGSCDCAVMAYPDIEYWNNNNPIKLLEYLAMGKVVICTDIWTFRDMLKGKKCAVFIKDNRSETIADAIRYCYNNRELLKDWGKSGIDIVSNRFTWRHHAKKILDFIEKKRLRIGKVNAT